MSSDLSPSQLLARERELMHSYSGVQLRGQGQGATPTDEPDRKGRERTWRRVAGDRMAAAPLVDDLWRQLLEVRVQQAELAGFSSYQEYVWRRMSHLDHTPDVSPRFHEAIEEWVTPALVRLHEERRRSLAVRRLRPWDLRLEEVDGCVVAGSSDLAATLRGRSAGFRRRAIERTLTSWALAAMVDAFEHSAYRDTAAISGERWESLWLRFLPGVDWSGLESFLANDWQTQACIFLHPFSAGAAFTLDEHALREAVAALEDLLRDGPGIG